MAFTLDKIVPWGRSFDEYVAMFDLSGQDLASRILGCGDGPASFNCILTRRGGHVVSVDPIYHFSAAEIGRFSLSIDKRTLSGFIRNKNISNLGVGGKKISAS